MSSWSQIARRIRVPLGFVLAAVYLWRAHPDWRSLAAGSIFIVWGLVLRAVASGHLRKNTEVTASGPYAHVRNPLYLGSLIMAAGFVAAARDWWLAAGMLVFFLAVYLPVILSEEAWMRANFPQFEDYARRVPRLWPRFGGAGAAQGRFSRELYLQHREYNALLGAVAMLAALVVKLLRFS
ncbi:MAG TPA: isoprenylcysteine carboxylmethyltransferase family protein [Terriglobales bacterium]|nr:isoprenylcysteine carboxylmethyltransferase family protein [Terriglobales bacterium]